MNNKKTLMIMIIIVISLCSCGKKTKMDKVSDIDYTVVEEAEIPKELKEAINEKKKEEFNITYTDKEYLYIAVGYGVQETGGYSISIEELYLSKNAVCVSTSLIGPDEQDLVLRAKSYPYIVIKMEYIDKEVITI